MLVKVSIIIPTFNREAQLRRTLYHLGQLPEHPSQYEILVVDNGSTDGTSNCVKEFKDSNPQIPINYFYDPIPGLLTGRHRGAKEAKGEILTFIDDDVHVSKKWLSAILAIMGTKPEVMLLTGPCLPLYEITPPQWVDELWRHEPTGKYCGWYSLLDFGNEIKLIDPTFVWGLNFSIRTSAFEKLQGFHPDNIAAHLQAFQGDGETGLSIKATDSGMIALYDPNAMLYHEIQKDRLTIEYLKKRAFYQGVCNSFTQIRREHGLYSKSKTDKSNHSDPIVKVLKTKIRKMLKRMDMLDAGYNHPASNILSDLVTEEKKGFEFHQESFSTREEVKNWVLRKNYLDYKLPSL